MADLTTYQLIAAALLIAAAALAIAAYRYRYRIPADYSGCRLERDYQRVWRNHHGGQTEVSVSGGRVDWIGQIDGTTHAAEIDFAAKWQQAVGQSLLYAAETGHAPGIVLILKRESDRRHVATLQRVIDSWRLPIRVWTVPE